ncbi:aquaporin-9-like [Anneissia japonica]|uniref:aquaporin-9-like n=1 Tax=Anneissia japonica TaxID=1529436 RepID=UPI0014254D70|nr:aquaporin-9-like [Anneissia japonica]
MTINLRLALGYTFGLCMCIENGGFLNPAITIVFKVLGKMKWKELFANVLAQFLGALLGAALIYSINYEGTEKPEVKSLFMKLADGVISISSIFFTSNEPATVANLQTFFVKSGLLMMGVMSIIDERSVNPPRYVQPFLIGTILFSVGLTTNHNTYCFLNLAQDIPPRIIAAYFCGCSDYWKPYDHTWWPIEVLGPITGAFAGAIIYIFLVEIHHKSYESDERIGLDFQDNTEEYIEEPYGDVMVPQRKESKDEYDSAYGDMVALKKESKEEFSSPYVDVMVPLYSKKGTDMHGRHRNQKRNKKKK